MEETGAKIPMIVIFAPTACGKTALVTDIFGSESKGSLAGKAEIISADSQAVYRFLNIGTAKPSEKEQSSLTHHLIDVQTPDIQFGVGDFIDLADKAALEIREKGKIPVMVGGSGFYVRSFILGLPETPISKPEIREKIKERLRTEGNGNLYHELKMVDREYARKIDLHDGIRISRALEVYYSTGRPLSSYKMPDIPRAKYDFCTIILERPREELYRRIDLRVDAMFEIGLAQEIEGLKKMGYGKDSPGMKAIGYSEFFTTPLPEDLPQTEKLAQIKDLIKKHSRRYAKKQYTIMRDIPGAIRLPADNRPQVEKIISEFLKAHLQ